MSTLSEERIATLLQPYFRAQIGPVLEPETERLRGILPGLSKYLDLLLRWNERTNLTAIKDPEQIVIRHFGESLFAGRVLEACLGGGGEVLDLGSGAGFPGVPLQLLLPKLQVTLAESQGKKAAFLREVVRALGLQSEVWAGRAQNLPATRSFDVVTLRAVDKPEQALAEAHRRIRSGGWLLHLRGEVDRQQDHAGVELLAVPGLHKAVIELRHF